jgi:hypothetical protein
MNGRAAGSSLSMSTNIGRRIAPAPHQAMILSDITPSSIFSFSFKPVSWQLSGVAYPIKKSASEACLPVPKYGVEWSQGCFLATLVSAGLWAPIYYEVNEHFPDAWWYDYAITFIVATAFLSVAWLTCILSSFLVKNGRKNSKAG